MNNHMFLHVQAAEMRRLLVDASDDPILEKQLRIRLADTEKKLAAISPPEVTLVPRVFVPARAAIFLRGESVQNSDGIRPSLAGEALIQYERMFTQQAIHDEREAARKSGRKNRRKGTPRPTLLFTGTPRGSFGLEFVPQVIEDGTLEIHAQSLRHVADALVLVGESLSEDLDEVVKQIPAPMLLPLKNFMKALAEHGAEIRLAFPNQSPRSLSVEKVQKAAERLDKVIAQEAQIVHGTMRGVTLETGKFDLLNESGDVISGSVSDDLSEEELERIFQLTFKPCMATLQKTTVSKIGVAATPTYVLLDAQPEPAA